MIKPAALVMAVVMVGVTAGTYYGLEMLPPGTLPPPLGRVPPQAPPPVAATSPETAAVASNNTAPATAAPAPQAEAPHAAPTEQELAEEPPPQSASPASAPPPATAPTLHAHVEPAPAPAQTAAAEPAPEPAATPAAEPAPAPAPKEAPKAAARPAAEKKSTEVAKAAPGETDTPPGPAKPKPPEADVIKPWWPDAAKMPENQLKLMYAGQVKGEQAIALLFSSPLALDSLQQHAQVKSEAGAAINGTWELGKNPRLAVFRGLEAGHRYTVVLQPEIADTKGLMLGATLNGPVYVQSPDTQK